MEWGVSKRERERERETARSGLREWEVEYR